MVTEGGLTVWLDVPDAVAQRNCDELEHDERLEQTPFVGPTAAHSLTHHTHTHTYTHTHTHTLTSERMSSSPTDAVETKELHNYEYSVLIKAGWFTIRRSVSSVGGHCLLINIVIDLNLVLASSLKLPQNGLFLLFQIQLLNRCAG